MCILFSVSFYLTICVSVCHSFHGPLRECLRAGLPPGLPSTAPPPVCISAVLGTLAYGFQTKTKNDKSNQKLNYEYIKCIIKYMNKQINKYDYL